jgi:hypothetical protein
MPSELLTKRFFAAKYGWTPDQVDDAPLDVLTWFPLIEEGVARAEEQEQKRAEREARTTRR